MVLTESELRELWRDGKNALPTFPPGTRFSPAAQDFLKDHHLQIRFAEASPLAPQSPAQPNPEWDKPAAFPVVLTGPAPVCAICGQPLKHKLDPMTQLDGGHFAPQTHPRIKFRGQLDSLNALLMLTAAEARHYQLLQLALGLDTLAAFSREIQSAEYYGRAVAHLSLNGKNEKELHEISHWPDKHLGLPHLAPGPSDHAILHWLNLTRALAREIELTALDLYGPQEHTHADKESPGSLPQALNRLSSAVYVLELLFKRGDLGWKI